VVVSTAGVAAHSWAQVTRVGVEFQVNSHATANQYRAVVAASRSGDFVVVWASNLQDGDLYGVFARRFTSSGVAVASEFRVNTYTSSHQYHPTVAAEGDGDFVVAWESFGQDGMAEGIFGRRFNSAGAPQAAEFQVTSRTNVADDSASAAIDDAGNFVIAWKRKEASSDEIFARRFNASGVPQALEFLVNAYTPGNQDQPAVATAGSGAFVVAWDDPGRDGSFRGVFGRRFDSAGAALDGDFQINTYTLSIQSRPFLSIGSDGAFVVTWTALDVDGEAQGVFARRFDAQGGPSGPEFQVTISTASGQLSYDVALDGDGEFIVVWRGDGAQDGAGTGIFARRFEAGGAPLTGELQVNSYTPGDQAFAAAAAAAGGAFVVAWSSASPGGDQLDVFAQRFGVPKTFDLDGNGATDALTDGLLFLRYLFGFRGGALIADALSGNCTRCIASLVESYAGGLSAMTLVKTAGPEFEVNSYTPLGQLGPAVASDANGDFVVAWHSSHEGSSYGILGRRFSSAGGPIAGEFLINSYVTGFQGSAAVALDGDGDFVVAWESLGQDGSDYGVFARRFSSSGVAQAAEFQVNTTTLYQQRQPAIAANAAGSFVIAWEGKSQDSASDYGVFARRFGSNGAPQGVEFRVNLHTPNDQTQPAVAVGSSGSFVVVWTSAYQDQYYDGVFGRRFGSSGEPQATEFQVSVRTLDYQEDPAVDIDGAGNFVVAWEGSNQDGDDDGIFARRFNSSGQAQTGDVQANLFTFSGQYMPAVGMANSGEFVVSWASYQQGGNNYDVFVRRFDSAGAAQSIELQVNSFGPGYQYRSAIGMEDNGDFVTAWRSDGQDGAGAGVFARRFAANRAGDIDGNGVMDALTDGLLLLRYLFGFRGGALVNGATAPDCTRCTAAAIESWIAAKI
jgi:hypothetical protein